MWSSWRKVWSKAVHGTLIAWHLTEKERKTLSSKITLYGLEVIEGKGGIRQKRSVKPKVLLIAFYDKGNKGSGVDGK